MTRISRCFHTLEKMQDLGLPLLVHGESTDPAVDVFDREKAFIEEILGPLVARFPDLRIVLRITSYNVCYTKLLRTGFRLKLSHRHVLPEDIFTATGGPFIRNFSNG